MIQLQILSGLRAGETLDSRRMPVTLGRSTQATFCLDEPGVFPQHCTFTSSPDGILFAVEPEALASINGAGVTEAVLRNGDLITLGSVMIRFGWSPVRQPSSRWMEWATWISLAALCGVQVWLIYWLNR